jgi:hypothetical protein
MEPPFRPHQEIGERLASRREADALFLLGLLTFGLIAVVAITCIGTWTVASHLSQPQPPENHPPVATVCSGCGTEWRAMTGDPSVRVAIEPITRCPECPMSVEEFEALKRKYGKPSNHLPPSASVLVEEPTR